MVIFFVVVCRCELRGLAKQTEAAGGRGRERSIIYRIARSVRAALEATLECNNIDFVLVFDVEAVNLGWKFDCHGYRLN